MKFNLIAIIMVLAFFSGATSATEYIYRDLMANTLPSPVCAKETEAADHASKPFNISKYSKRFCQSQGYGWHVEKIKEVGKTVCDSCTGEDTGKKRCHLEEVVVTCKRIKPGSVGMLPGKS